jgi:hypothetical protein
LRLCPERRVVSQTARTPRVASRLTRATLVAALAFALLALPLAARADDPPRLTFAQLVDSIRANFDVTQQIKTYAGREVEIQGFIVPAGPPDLSFFLLSRVSALGNYCCEIPTGQDETVYVFAATGLKLVYDPLRVYRVRGVFEAGKDVDRTYGVSMFRIRGARVDEAVGAKVFKVGP